MDILETFGLSPKGQMNGAALAVGAVGLLAGLAMLTGRSGGTLAGNFSAGPMKGSFAYQGRPQQGSRASAWNDYVGSRVPELMSQGHSAPEAMRQAANEYHGRS
jgi:hypothetical protein